MTGQDDSTGSCWVRVRRYARDGHAVAVLVKMGLHEVMMNSAIYLYESAADALVGTRVGGSGFAIGFPYADFPGRFHYYFVTNRHVSEIAPVVRTNTVHGGTCITEYTTAEWVHHPVDDLAVVPAVDTPGSQVTFTSTDQFVTPDLIEALSIGAGDEVYMIGRFVSHAGSRKNIPTVRFGNIAMMPTEPVTNDRGQLVDALLADMRSRAGFSGSPTYVKINQPGRRFHPKFPERPIGTWLLGVEWADWHDDLPVKGSNGQAVPQGWYVDVPNGLCCVSPAWKLLELLDNPQLAQTRAEAEENFRKKFIGPRSPRNN